MATTATTTTTLPTGFEGNLTEQQSTCLNELKEKLMKTEYWDDYQRDPDKERFLLAFLRATMKDKSGERVFQVDPCMDRLIATFKWRREYNYDEILASIQQDGPKPENFDLFRQYYVALDVMNEETGKYVRFNRFGRFITTLDPSVLTTEQWIKNFAYDTMIIQHKLRQASTRLGREISTYVSCSDAAGISLMGIAGRGRLSFIKFMSGIAADHFPETLGQTLIIRVPWIFPKVFGVIKPFLDTNTLAKFQFSSDIPVELLRSYLPPSSFPKEFGGDGDMILATSKADEKA